MKTIRTLFASALLLAVPSVMSAQITAAKAAATKAVAATNANTEKQVSEGNAPGTPVLHAGQRITTPAKEAPAKESQVKEASSKEGSAKEASAKEASAKEAQSRETPATAVMQTTVTAEAAGTVGPSSAPSPTKGSAIPTQITIDREVFSYASTGRRDPYASLMTTNEIRPLLSDLRLTAIAFDPDGNNSVAILRDNVTKQQHRVKVGQQLGRLRVANIKVKSVVFTIDEFGFNRQETLQVRSDTTKARTP